MMLAMRGRLIHQFLVELGQLDTRATEAVEGGGYDPVLREPRQIADGTQVGADTRRERQQFLRAQVDPSMFNAARTLAGGNVREARVICLVHTKDLERAKLLDEGTGAPKLRVGDRLVSVRDRQGKTIFAPPTPSGLYLRQVLPQSFSFGGRVNLYELEFVARTQAR